MSWQPLHGLLLVDKPVGLSSAAVVGKVKWHLKQAGAPKNVKIGHGGTLDPFATGLLPLGVGHGTKALQALLEGPKGYQFTLTFGTATTTQDCLGAPTATSPVVPTLAEIQAILPRFTGPQQQTPPAFSALKVNGQRAYALARAGETVTLEPRAIEIYTLELIDYNPPHAHFTASVSKGTYIRTLGADLATALGSVGHLTALRRTQHGPYQLAQALSLTETLEILDNALKLGQMPPCLHPLPAPAAG
ncbi:MAG: tRNA pseudouridine(55) synthase TruB [Alphaproteobacteria bacterium]|nr:tRNA pseudouridine(55) synthase TruB [Alphaproteobacteria bacterium]